MASTNDLGVALAALKGDLLVMAAGDLMERKSGLPGAGVGAAVIGLQQKRRAVLDAAKNLTNEQFTAALMAANFLGG